MQSLRPHSRGLNQNLHFNKTLGCQSRMAAGIRRPSSSAVGVWRLGAPQNILTW